MSTCEECYEPVYACHCRCIRKADHESAISVRDKRIAELGKESEILRERVKETDGKLASELLIREAEGKLCKSVWKDHEKQFSELLAKLDTEKELSSTYAKYIAAIPALCRGEDVTCALHVSAPIMELRKRIAELEADQQWQPIETAPKLEHVLVLCSGGQRYVLYLTNNGEGLMDNWRWPKDGTAAGFWPTHWLPLPNPPAKEDK